MYKNGKWARELLAAQRPDGSWGPFHTLAAPNRGNVISTEQAIRRLAILGFSYEDAPIHLAIHHLRACLAGREVLQNNREVTLDWDIFTELMLSAWIRLFTDADENANAVAKRWAGIAAAAFSSGAYRDEDYAAAYDDAFRGYPRGRKRVGFDSFYPAALLPGALDRITEQRVLQYFLVRPEGIYYIAPGPLCDTPSVFRSRGTSRYLGALELLSRFPCSQDALSFAVSWLEKNRNENGGWDMGPQAKDGIYFPLSDSWRTAALREHDCTYRIERLLTRLR